MHRSDIGATAVDAIRSTMQVDPEWTEHSARGFAWWGNEFRQEVQSSAVWEEDGQQLARITIRTTLLRCGSTAAATAQVLEQLNHHAPGGCFRRDGDEVVHEMGVLVDESALAWVPYTVAVYGTLALTIAAQQAREAASVLGAKPAESAHPRSGRRGVPDDILNVPRQLVIPGGLGGSAWDQPQQFAEAANLLNATGLGFVADASGRGGLMGEVGYGRESAFLVLAPTNDEDPSRRVGPPLDPHPHLGHGLIAWLVLPSGRSGEAPDEVSARLNSLEIAPAQDWSEAGAMHFGAWIAGPGTVVAPAYKMFVPNLLANYVNVQNVAAHMAHRARRISRLLVPGVEVLSGEHIATLRLEQLERSRFVNASARREH